MFAKLKKQITVLGIDSLRTDRDVGLVGVY
jgi:hypothetical protein